MCSVYKILLVLEFFQTYFLIRELNRVTFELKIIYFTRVVVSRGARGNGLEEEVRSWESVDDR